MNTDAQAAGFGPLLERRLWAVRWASWGKALAFSHPSSRRGSIRRMSLPNADRAVVDPAKIRDYLLAGRPSCGPLQGAVFRLTGLRRRSMGAAPR